MNWQSKYIPNFKRMEDIVRENHRIPEGKDNALVAVAVSNLILAEVMMNLGNDTDVRRLLRDAVKRRAKWVCKICVITKGVKGSELDEWPDEGDDEAIARHLETEHGVIVRREGETEEQAQERFVRERGGPDHPEGSRIR